MHGQAHGERASLTFRALDTYGSGVLLHDLPDACRAKLGAAGQFLRSELR